MFYQLIELKSFFGDSYIIFRNSLRFIHLKNRKHNSKLNWNINIYTYSNEIYNFPEKFYKNIRKVYDKKSNEHNFHEIISISKPRTKLAILYCTGLSGSGLLTCLRQVCLKMSHSWVLSAHNPKLIESFVSKKICLIEILSIHILNKICSILISYKTVIRPLIFYVSQPENRRLLYLSLNEF